MVSIEVVGDGAGRVSFGPSSGQAAGSGLMTAVMAVVELSDLTIVGAGCGIWNWTEHNQSPVPREGPRLDRHTLQDWRPACPH